MIEYRCPHCRYRSPQLDLATMHIVRHQRQIAKAMAKKLTANQRNIIESLSREDWCVIGCGESVARNLTKATLTRPALVEMRKLETDEWPHFRLTDAGAAMQDALK